ncbi:MAG: ABC transporter ATP-binding protein [Nitrospirae bacterium]|jgi:cobalt/nickel transport system ATP-binding protein|nr:ABC transporter ATP-binding protein [Nitrospirota bacterium]
MSFGYANGRKIFNNLNFSMEKGDRIGLIGPNGAGKTTLLHLIMGLLKPDSGEIEIFGKVRKEDRDFTEVRQRIGLLFQDSDDQLFCPTVEEDIAFGPLNLGKTHEDARIIVRETCEKLGLNGYEKKITNRLSEGEKRLVALATVVAMHPECYLLDEPATGLDEKTTQRLLNYLRENTHTYIIITHDLGFLKNVAEKMYVLSDSFIKEL